MVNQDELQIERFTIAPALNSENIETEKVQEGETETVDLEGEQAELWSLYTDFLEIFYRKSNIFGWLSVSLKQMSLIIVMNHLKNCSFDDFLKIVIWILIGLQVIKFCVQRLYHVLSSETIIY